MIQLFHCHIYHPKEQRRLHAHVYGGEIHSSRAGSQPGWLNTVKVVYTGRGLYLVTKNKMRLCAEKMNGTWHLCVNKICHLDTDKFVCFLSYAEFSGKSLKSEKGTKVDKKTEKDEGKWYD